MQGNVKDAHNIISMMIGAADMGTGCDTILAQMAAEGEMSIDRINKLIESIKDETYSPFKCNASHILKYTFHTIWLNPR